MRLLIIDQAGAALDFAMRAQRDGHKVKLFIRQTEKTKAIGRGLVEIIEDFHPWLHWPDLVFLADNTKYLRELDTWRALGVPIIGPSPETALWELDRGIGMEVLRKHGIETTPCKEFNDYNKAIVYVKKEGRRFVSKPSGDADKALSYCAKTPADMVFMLQRWQKFGKIKAPFILQEFVEGVEMAVGGWFGPGGFNTGWCENFEFKKLMDGDKGVATGEQGTVLRYVRRSKLARIMLEPLGELLAKAGYVGYIDVNCILDEQGHAWPLEFTMRPGWPTYNIQQALHTGDCVQWLHDLSQGLDAGNFTLDLIAMGVVLSIPDYPYSHLTRKEVVGIPVYGITDGLLPRVHFCEMQQGEAPVDVGGKVETRLIPVTAGDYVLVMSSVGNTVYDAKQKVYRRLKRLSVPNNPMYRTDIGDRLAKQLPVIQAHGYATGMVFNESSI